SVGISITMAPTRAKTSMKVAATIGSQAMSMRITECPGPHIRTRLRRAILRMLEPKGHSQKYNCSAALDLTFAISIRGNTEANVKFTALRTLHQPPMIRDDIRIISL